MPRTMPLLVVLAVVRIDLHRLCQRNPEIIDPAEAAKDPDFKIQGEYVGEGTWSDGEPRSKGRVHR